MGKSSASERVADVAGLNKGSSAGHPQHTFYAIYCDSTLKAWNADVSWGVLKFVHERLIQKRTNYYLTLSDSAELSMHRNGAAEDRDQGENLKKKKKKKMELEFMNWEEHLKIRNENRFASKTSANSAFKILSQT